MRKTRFLGAELPVVVGDFVAFVYSRRVTDAEFVREIRQLKEAGSLPGTLHQGRTDHESCCCLGDADALLYS